MHAAWGRESRLCLWAEDASLPATAPRRGGRPAAKPRPRPHPFACPAERVAEGVATLTGAASASEGELTLLLPSSKDGPQASPQLLRDDDAIGAGPAGRIAAWNVPALEFPPGPALDLLLALPPGAPPGVACGESLRFLAEAAKLALELVARGRLLPALCRTDDGWAARWRPVTDDPADAERLRALAGAMPPLVRSELVFSHEGNAPEAVIGDLVAAIVDAAARGALAGSSRRRATKASAPVDAWLAALSTGDGLVDADPWELAALAEELEAWRQVGLATAERGTFRTCFRLVPPPDEEAGEAGGDPWRVEILMQAKDDPSVLVPAGDVWAANGNGLTVLQRRLVDPQERLLGGLGHALRLWPDLEPALREPAPTGVELEAEAAYRFLREAAPALEQAGFAVQTPPWWNERLSVKLHARPLDDDWEEGDGLLGIGGLCAFQWRLALGDASLSLVELRQLAALKLPLVKSRGQWIALRPEDVEAALAFFERAPREGTAPIGELLRAGLGLDSAELGLPVSGIEAEGWLKALLGSDGERRLEQIGTPAALEGELRPYQERGLAWLRFLSSLGLGACLADDMGLGKTVQLLALLLAERERPEGRHRPGPTLLVCPMSVVGNWEREAERFAPSLRVHVHHGRERLAGRDFARAARRADLVITTYALALRDREALDTVKWDRVALDEAQNIKTSTTKQTRAIRAIKARQRVALTGTPVENRLSELHSIMDFLNPGLLGPEARFRKRFATPIERYRDEAAAALLKRATGPFILRRLKTDKSIIADLPEKIEMKVLCNLTREQATLYQAAVDEMLEAAAQAVGIERRGIVLAAMMKLKQVCNHPAQLLKDRSQLAGRSGKLARLEEILEEALVEGDRALIFTQFTQMGHMLKAHLQERLGREALFLHGGTPKAARDELVARFQSADGPPLFLLSLKAGGTGLNLTAANHVIHFDRWWNPAVEDQATDRAFRIGQRRNVQVRKLTCVGTLEERIDKMIEQKKDLAERIIGTGEAWLTELDTAQLRELVALSGDAVAEE